MTGYNTENDSAILIDQQSI